MPEGESEGASMSILKPSNENIKPPTMILVGESYLEDSMRTIRGYCAKHPECDGCKFEREDGVCYFIGSTTPPCDWEIPWESEVEK